jgi:hypothetical protein
VRDRASAIVTGLRTSLETLLTPEQFQRFTTGLRDRLQDRDRDRLKDREAGQAHRMELLTKLLALSDDQVAAILAALAEFEPRREAVRARIADGSLAFADALYESMVVFEAHRSALEAILNETQRARLATLRRLGMKGMGMTGGLGGPGPMVPLYL